jgi:hypothetical protein
MNDRDIAQAFGDLASDAMSGFSGSMGRLVKLLPAVRLIVPVHPDARPGGMVAIMMLRDEKGRRLLPAFTTDESFRRWQLAKSSGTLPAVTIFEETLAGPFDALVLDPAGPRRTEMVRLKLQESLALMRSGLDN